jgi:hypothetical protein
MTFARLAPLVAAIVLGSLAGCHGQSPHVQATATPAHTKVPVKVIAETDVENAPKLREGRDYTVAAEPPTTIRSKITYFYGLVSATEAFGTLDSPSPKASDDGSVVLVDVSSGDVRTLSSLPGQSQVIGMSYSDRYITWSETPSSDASAEPWIIKSFDRSTGTVRTIASSTALGVENPPWLPPYGVIPRVDGDDAVFISADSRKLPATASAYRVKLDGSSKPAALAHDVQGVYPDGKHLIVVRDGQFFSLDRSSGRETAVDSQKRGSVDCPGAAAQGVVVECDDVRGRSRLTVLEADKGITEIRLPKSNDSANVSGVAYLGCTSDWVTFTFDDKAYALDLKTKKLGRFANAQYIVAGASAGRTIRYAPLWKSPTDVKAAPFVKLHVR